MNLTKAWDKLSGLMGEILHAMFLLRDKPGMVRTQGVLNPQP